LESDSVEEVTLWRLNSLSPWSKAQIKSSCKIYELPYVAHIFLSCVILFYENVDIVFIKIYPIHEAF